MRKNKTLYISDLDGTLLNQSAELSEYTANVLNTMIAKNVKFSVATARTASSSTKILSEVSWHIPLVLMNGVLIYDTEHKQYIQTLSLAEETAINIINVFKRLNITGLMYEFKDNEQRTYYEPLDNEPIRSFIDERRVRYNKVFLQTNSFADIPLNSIIYFTLLDTHERLQLVHDALAVLPNLTQIFYKDNYSPDLWYLEIHSDKASKRHGVEYLRNAYGFDHIVGFGDNLNDLPMFEACDVRVAVENAKPEVKAAADYICGVNYCDGVAKWLEQNAL